MRPTPAHHDLQRVTAHWARKPKTHHARAIPRWPLDIRVPQAFALRIANAFPGRVFNHAVSIGCGKGDNEITLFRMGVVNRVRAFEVSAARAGGPGRGRAAGGRRPPDGAGAGLPRGGAGIAESSALRSRPLEIGTASHA